MAEPDLDAPLSRTAASAAVADIEVFSATLRNHLLRVLD
jgi:hypothetical protein